MFFFPVSVFRSALPPTSYRTCGGRLVLSLASLSSSPAMDGRPCLRVKLSVGEDGGFMYLYYGCNRFSLGLSDVWKALLFLGYDESVLRMRSRLAV